MIRKVALALTATAAMLAFAPLTSGQTNAGEDAQPFKLAEAQPHMNNAKTGTPLAKRNNDPNQNNNPARKAGKSGSPDLNPATKLKSDDWERPQNKSSK